MVEVVNTVKWSSRGVWLWSMPCAEVDHKDKPPIPHRSKLFIKVKVFKQAFEIRDEIKAFFHDTSNASFLKK